MYIIEILRLVRNSMSQRTEQVNSLLQQALGDIFSRAVEAPTGALITITRVEVSPDLKQATVYIDVIPENNRGTALETLNKAKGRIQKELGKRVEIRTTPNLNFKIDEKEVYASEIDKILDELN